MKPTKVQEDRETDATSWCKDRQRPTAQRYAYKGGKMYGYNLKSSKIYKIMTTFFGTYAIFQLKIMAELTFWRPKRNTSLSFPQTKLTLFCFFNDRFQKKTNPGLVIDSIIQVSVSFPVF